MGGMHAMHMAPRGGGMRSSAPRGMHAFEGARHMQSTPFVPRNGMVFGEHREGTIGRQRPGEGREEFEERGHHRFSSLPFWYGYTPFGYYGDYYDAYPFYYGGEYPVYVPSAPYVGEGPEQTEPTLQGYLDEATSAFLAHRYEAAARIAGHAAVDYPNSARVHEILSLALFAMGNYGGAAIQAHAALTLAPASDWPTLYRYYGDVAIYTDQLHALEKYVRENPSSAPGAFLLAYHDLMMGHREAAHRNFEKAAELAPQDSLAQKMAQQSGGKPVAKG